jgi:hypothetical protein
MPPAKHWSSKKPATVADTSAKLPQKEILLTWIIAFSYFVQVVFHALSATIFGGLVISPFKNGWSFGAMR